MNRKVVNALFSLFNKGVAVKFPGEGLGFAVDLLKGLIHGNRSDWNRAVPDNPFTGFVDVFAGGKIHHGVCAPARRPKHLFNFLTDVGRER